MEKHAAVAAGTTRCLCGTLAVATRGEKNLCVKCLEKVDAGQVKEAGASRIPTLEEQQRQGN